MARDNFPAVMEEVFAHEGGLSMLRSDPGNWTGGKVGVGELRGTNLGIASHAHPNVDIKNLTKAQAREIYRRQYWDKVKGDDLPVGIDLVTMDPAVNSGVRRGAQWLQRAVGVAADGKVGPVTINAALASDHVAVIVKACAIRMGFLRGLSTFTTFGRGWSRRVASVEAVGVRMVAEAKAAPARPVLLEQKAKAEQAAARETTAAGTVGAGGAGTTTLADLPTWGLIGVGVAVAVVVIMLIGRSRNDRDRAEAYQRVAEEAKP